jgi:hypothetical protein
MLLSRNRLGGTNCPYGNTLPAPWLASLVMSAEMAGVRDATFSMNLREVCKENSRDNLTP